MNIKLKQDQIINYKGVELTELIGGIKNINYVIYSGSMKRYFEGQSNLKCSLSYSIHLYKNYELMENEHNELVDLRINVQLDQKNLLSSGIMYQDATEGIMLSERGMYEYALSLNDNSDNFEII